ncbi:MAG: ferredoxin [Actinomycetia bacterium]|nr:ferredoxin [Actinomycetes bacterium]MCH9830669.1 ferredoxin [Actinomycetes bacterium]
MKIDIDMDKCQHYGQCVFEAEDIFQLDDDGNIQYTKEVPDDRQDDVDNAVDVCPMQAISFTTS